MVGETLRVAPAPDALREPRIRFSPSDSESPGTRANRRGAARALRAIGASVCSRLHVNEPSERCASRHGVLRARANPARGDAQGLANHCGQGEKRSRDVPARNAREIVRW